jgi:hypothetical protein
MLPLVKAGSANSYVTVTINVLPDPSAGSISIGGTGTVPSYPYSFVAPSGSSITLIATPSSGYKLEKWVVNGTEYAPGTLTVTATGNRMEIDAVFTFNLTVSVIETVVGKVYVSLNGVTWIEPKPLSLDVLPVKQVLGVYINASVTSWTQKSIYDIFNFTQRTVSTPNTKYSLVIQNICKETCYNVTYYVYDANGTLRYTGTLRNQTVIVPYNSNFALYLMAINGKIYGVYTTTTLAPVAQVPDWLAPLIPLIPLAFFVSIAMKSNTRDTAIGIIFYAFIVAPLYQVLGLPRYMIPVSGVLITFGLILLFADRYIRY